MTIPPDLVSLAQAEEMVPKRTYPDDLDDDEMWRIDCVNDYAKVCRRQIAQALSAIRAERDRLAAENARLREAVALARDTFGHYGNLHAAKPDNEKAERNYALRNQMVTALRTAPAEQKEDE